MPAGLITSGQHGDDCRRREHVNRDAAGPQDGRGIACRRPAQQRVSTDGERCVIQHEESAVRQTVDGPAVLALGAPLQTFRVEHPIHLRGAGPVAQTVRLAPVVGKDFRVPAPALEAGPVPGGERSRLVEKKQFGIEPPPYVAVPSFEPPSAAP